MLLFWDGIGRFGIDLERKLGGMVPTALVMLLGPVTSHSPTNTPNGADAGVLSRLSNQRNTCRSAATSTSIIEAACSESSTKVFVVLARVKRQRERLHGTVCHSSTQQKKT